MPANKTQINAFARMRLQQIAYLAALERDHGGEFNELGKEILNRFINSMIADCELSGVDPAIIAAALTGNAPERPE